MVQRKIQADQGTILTTDLLNLLF